MSEPIVMTHGFCLSMEPDAQGVRRSVEIMKRSDGAYQILITTTPADAEPFETRVGFSHVGMQLLVRACNEAALNMHSWPLPNDLPVEKA